MRISDWSSDVCSSDLKAFGADMGSDLDGTRSYMGDVLGGKYLDQQNPYLESMIDQTNDSVMERVNALFSTSGQTGSSRQDRKSVVSGKSVSGRVDLVCRRIIKKKKKNDTLTKS